ncbi:MAG: hypothetical protein H6741_10190 [Alphaproteobacteria bacterium]|nr:hypothetical protein [Alphaproteobacteria bacterium]
MARKVRVTTPKAPPALGASNQAVRAGDMVYVSGILGRDPRTGDIVPGLEAQVLRALENIDGILVTAGATRFDIVRTTLILVDMDSFPTVDQLYGRWIPGRGNSPLPARTVIGASELPGGALVMIEVTAVASN